MSGCWSPVCDWFKPCPRYGHTLTSVDEKRPTLFGGYCRGVPAGRRGVSVGCNKRIGDNMKNKERTVVRIDGWLLICHGCCLIMRHLVVVCICTWCGQGNLGILLVIHVLFQWSTSVIQHDGSVLLICICLVQVPTIHMCFVCAAGGTNEEVTGCVLQQIDRPSGEVSNLQGELE